MSLHFAVNPCIISARKAEVANGKLLRERGREVVQKHRFRVLICELRGEIGGLMAQNGKSMKSMRLSWHAEQCPSEVTTTKFMETVLRAYGGLPTNSMF